jgi:hypothetical protein
VRAEDEIEVGTRQASDVGTGNSDCAPYDGCTSFQEMNGTRPPQ